MNWLLWILAALGILLGVLILLATYLVFGKLKLTVDYRKERLTLWVGVLFFRVKIYPDEEKQRMRKERYRAMQEKHRNKKHAGNAPARQTPAVSAENGTNPSPKAAASPPSTGKNTKGVRAAAKKELRRAVQSVKLRDYAMVLKTIVTEFIAKFQCKSLKISASVGGEEAMDIAMEYGTINALLYPVLGAFSAAGNLKRCDVQITPDFTAEETTAEGRAVFTFRLFRAFGCIWKLSEKLS